MSKQFQDRLYESLIRYGLRQDIHFSGKAAKLLGVSRVTVNNWLAGRHRPSTRNLMKMARILRVKPKWLISGRGSAYEKSNGQESNKPLDKIDNVSKTILGIVVMFVLAFLVGVGIAAILDWRFPL